MNRNPPIVDLTSTTTRPHPVRLSSSPQVTSNHASSSIYIDRQLPRGTKRRRLDSDDGESRASAPSALAQPEDDNVIEAIDLTEVDGSTALAKVLAKQREDAVRAQQSTEHEKGRSILASYKCPVCMDTPEVATSTACGTFRSVLEILSKAPAF